MKRADYVTVSVSLPEHLVSFARACEESEDISACVVIALQLLRRDIEELAQSFELN
jgi:hypothetical protein